MKPIALENHPMYVWLRKDKDYNFFSKFNNYLPTVKEYELNPKDKIKLLDDMHFFLIPELQNKRSLKNIKDGLDKYSSDLIRVCNYIKEILPLDTNKKSLFWCDRTIALIDQFKPLSEFLDTDYPESIKNKNVRKFASGLTEDLLLKVDVNSSDCLNDKKVNELIEFFDGRFSRYGSEPAWDDLMKRQPSLFYALYANKHGYELKPQELKSLFDILSSGPQFYTGRDDEDGGNHLATMFAELVANSIYFKNTLAPTKNLSLNIQKFFNSKIVEEPIYKRDFFKNAFFTHKIFDAKKMELELSKHERLGLMGKANLSKDDYDVFEEKMQAQRAAAPKVRKVKL